MWPALQLLPLLLSPVFNRQSARGEEQLPFINYNLSLGVPFARREKLREQASARELLPPRTRCGISADGEDTKATDVLVDACVATSLYLDNVPRYSVDVFGSQGSAARTLTWVAAAFCSCADTAVGKAALPRQKEARTRASGPSLPVTNTCVLFYMLSNAPENTPT